MNKIFASLALTALISCTAHRQLNRSRQDSVAATSVQHTVQEDSLRRELSLHYAWQDRQQVYQAEIIPNGPFRLNADSGFRGEASAVHITAVRQEQRAEAAQQLAIGRYRRTSGADSVATVQVSAKTVDRTRQRETFPGQRTPLSG